MRLQILAAALCTIAFVACSSNDGGDPAGDTKTLELQARDDGSLNYCDDAGNCTSLPNPDKCVTLTVTIDTASGKACQVCTAADGTKGANNCSKPSVACDVVTIPDPDCVVCAYVNGTVIFSSCQPTTPTCYTTNYDGSVGSSGPDSATSSSGIALDAAGKPIAPPQGCTVCVDEAGRRISQDCPPSCLEFNCPLIECAEGYRVVSSPGECCSHCEPIVNCQDVACTAMVPYCPNGQGLVKDPSQCCGWYCEPHGCDATLACTDVIIECAPGYRLDYAAPHCCGGCVPDNGCNSDDDCQEDEYCATPNCPCYRDEPSDACAQSPECHAQCIPDGTAF